MASDETTERWECCGQEIGKGCTANPGSIRFGDETYDFAPKPPPPHRCHDCGCAVGEFHHVGCDWEQCPVCGEQRLSCEHDGVHRAEPVRQ